MHCHSLKFIPVCSWHYNTGKMLDRFCRILKIPWGAYSTFAPLVVGSEMANLFLSQC
jgi:hypothetical protein